MRIRNITLYEEDGRAVLTAKCDEFDLFYKFPQSIKPRIRADAFVAACLIPAMANGNDIELDTDVEYSPRLLKNLDKLQDIFCQWSKYFNKKLQKVRIQGGIAKELDQGLDQCISFFSGGVDGSYTLFKNFEEIDLLFFAKGIDMQLNNDELFSQALERNRLYLESKNKELVEVETNVRFLGYETANVGWKLCFGGGLASIALAANAKKCFIASGVAYGTLYPEGSNFVTDQLWSSDFTEIVHDGAEASRIEKLARILQDPGLAEVLRVCWQDKEYNCGKCEKCLRTMIAIRALQMSVPTFPELTDSQVKNEVKRIRLYTQIDYDFLMENLEQAEQSGDVLLVRALNRLKRSYELKELAREIDKTLFSGLLVKWLTRKHVNAEIRD